MSVSANVRVVAAALDLQLQSSSVHAAREGDLPTAARDIPNGIPTIGILRGTDLYILPGA